jgi:hypothetical protein
MKKRITSDVINSKKFYLNSSTVSGTGLFVYSSYKKGDFIDYIHGPTEYITEFTDSQLAAMINWIGTSRHTWINTDESPFRFINHSCDPNVAVVTKRRVVAIKDINAETEITMDYSLTDGDPEWQIGPCTCGARNCRGSITGIGQIPKQYFQRMKPYVSKTFQKIYEYQNK